MSTLSNIIKRKPSESKRKDRWVSLVKVSRPFGRSSDKTELSNPGRLSYRPWNFKKQNSLLPQFLPLIVWGSRTICAKAFKSLINDSLSLYRGAGCFDPSIGQLNSPDKRTEETSPTCSERWKASTITAMGPRHVNLSTICFVFDQLTSLMMIVPSMASLRSTRVFLTRVMTRCMRSISCRRKMFIGARWPILCRRALTSCGMKSGGSLLSMSSASFCTTDSRVSPPPPPLSFGWMLTIVLIHSAEVLVEYLQEQDQKGGVCHHVYFTRLCAMQPHLFSWYMTLWPLHLSSVVCVYSMRSCTMICWPHI